VLPAVTKVESHSPVYPQQAEDIICGVYVLVLYTLSITLLTHQGQRHLWTSAFGDFSSSP
jgi:hypothetical protein